MGTRTPSPLARPCLSFSLLTLSQVTSFAKKHDHQSDVDDEYSAERKTKEKAG
jgi:hypothetical protein